ncbi:MAG: sugar transferase, partial [Ignavibacteria bacterium]|nr:sugar transferase [Ignavibacteria bacterium]
MSKRIERFLVIGIDFITINLSWIVFFYFRVESGWLTLITEPDFLIPMIAVYLYWFFLFLFVGMYRTWFAASRFDELATLFKSSFFGVLIMFFVIFIDDTMHQVSSSQRYIILLYWIIFLFLVGLGRILIRSFQRALLLKGIGRRNTVIVGLNERAIDIFKQINRYRALGLDVIGFVTLNENKSIENYKDVKILGSLDEIESIVTNNNVKEIVISLDKNEHEQMLEVIAKCDIKNVSLKIVPDLYEVISGQARTGQI